MIPPLTPILPPRAPRLALAATPTHEHPSGLLSAHVVDVRCLLELWPVAEVTRWRGRTTPTFLNHHWSTVTALVHPDAEPLQAAELLRALADELERRGAALRNLPRLSSGRGVEGCGGDPASSMRVGAELLATGRAPTPRVLDLEDDDDE